jgi:dienelactone hydrolase
MWNARGYAAIAMDTCGCLPGGEHGKRPRHEMGGPGGWGGFDQLAKAPEDQWPFQAVADVLLAHSLLRARPEVDPERIGLTGISWGGYLTCIVSGVDSRFRFAAPVYGCGFLGEDSTWKDNIARLGAPGQEWLRRWDPSVYVGQAAMPMLWVDGTNDFAYPLDSLQKTYRLPKGERTLSTRVRMPHGQGPGAAPEEIHAFADRWLKGGPALGNVSAPTVSGETISASYELPQAPAKAELNFTKATGPWKERLWETIPAELDAEKHSTRAQLPAGTRVAFLNVIDQEGRVLSSEHVELP